jgi:hypothetical protein
LQFDASALATLDLLTTERYQVVFPYLKLVILILNTIKMLAKQTFSRTQKPFSSAKAAPCRAKLSVRCSAASEGSARRDVLLAGEN